MSKCINVGLICGGKSLEHQVTLFPVESLKNALEKSKYKVFILAIDQSGKWYFGQDMEFFLNSNDLINIALDLSKPTVVIAPNGEILDYNTKEFLAKIDVFFPITADYSIQGFLDLLGIPYVGSGIYGAAICRDKDITKRLLRERGYQIIPYITLRTNQTISFEEASMKLSSPLFIKPARLGSSIGVFKVNRQSEFSRALEEAFKCDSKVLIEQAIEGREIECAVLGNDYPEVADAIGEVTDLKDFFSFEAKYVSQNVGNLKIPAEISPETADKVRETALSVFHLLECRGLARVDFILQPDDSFYVLEINAAPGIGKDFTYSRLWEASGLPYHQLIERLMQLALEKNNPHP